MAISILLIAIYTTYNTCIRTYMHTCIQYCVRICRPYITILCHKRNVPCSIRSHCPEQNGPVIRLIPHTMSFANVIPHAKCHFLCHIPLITSNTISLVIPNTIVPLSMPNTTYNKQYHVTCNTTYDIPLSKPYTTYNKQHHVTFNFCSGCRTSYNHRISLLVFWR